jgi:hypothetical chaperone protein
MTRLLGIDFGTTNSVVASLEPDGSVTTVSYPVGQAKLDVFRTVLCFWNEEKGGVSTRRHAAGPYAVDSYLEDPLDSRLIMSMKTYLAQRSFSRTNIFGKIFTLEQMVSLFLNGLLAETDRNAHVVAGRPVRFAGDSADDDFGEQRLRASFAEAGFAAIDVALEPEAAGYRFARTLDRPATVLVGDFGGGTSDFSLMRFDPRGAARVVPLGYAGIGIAGDTFDYRIIDRVVSPLLGKGDTYRIMGKDLPVPPDYFTGFARWHRLSLMRTPRTLRAIEEVAAASAHPHRLRTLIRLIEEELGYQLYQTVSAVKAELSRHETATLRFAHGDFAIEREIARHEFDGWIADDLRRMSATVDQALANAGLRSDEVDRVFLTGGTSFVPAVRALFEARFGAEAVSGGGEFVSVAEGLALIGRDRAERGVLAA